MVGPQTYDGFRARPRARVRTVVDAERDRAVLDLPTWERYLAAFDHHAPGLFRAAVLLLRGSHADAEDALQEVFLAAHRPWAEGRVDDLGAYLRRSLTNRVASGARHRGVVDRFLARQRPDDRVGRDPGDTATDHVALQRALDALPPGQRAAIVLRYHLDLSIAATADALGVSEGTVKSQVADGLAGLRTRLAGTA